MLLLSGFAVFGLLAVFITGAVTSTSVSVTGFFTEGGFLIYLMVGFAAQMVDGALGMAYGATSTSMLLSAGVPPAAASASVHIAEVFTTGASGFSHWRFGNVDKDLFKRLALPGAIGAGLGAYVLTSFDGNILKPYVAAYLLIMGAVIIRKAVRRSITMSERKGVGLLALFGGFIDASGGGGWGPVVASTLLGSGRSPRLTIGTVNASEFLIALTASGVFTIFLGVNHWDVIAGLVAGGLLAAPLGAFVASRVKVRPAMVLVGLLIIFLSLRTLIKTFS